MDTQLLREQDVFPSNEVLENALGESYGAFESLMETIAGAGYGLTYEWNFYKDGKSWLCKVCYRKKTVFWLSVWSGYFKTSFFFTAKHLQDIASLDMDVMAKEDFFKREPAGRLLPMIFNIHRKEQLGDVLKVIELKKRLLR